MKTTEIEIYDINKVKGGYEVEYSGSDIAIKVDTGTLVDYIIENELCVVELYNMKNNDYDRSHTDPYNYLSDNYLSVVTEYLNTL